MSNAPWKSSTSDRCAFQYIFLLPKPKKKVDSGPFCFSVWAIMGGNLLEMGNAERKENESKKNFPRRGKKHKRVAESERSELDLSVKDTRD